MRGGWLILVASLAGLCGCQSPPGPIFPEISPPIVWPPPPDQARIRYVGELRGEASLGARPAGWEAVQAALAGPRPTVEFSHPTAVAVAGERVFVTDPGLGAMHVLDLAPRRYRLVRGNPSDPLQVPMDVVRTAIGSLMVVDRGRAALDSFDFDGNWHTRLRWPEIQAPVAATWQPTTGTLWIADVAAHACFAIAGTNEIARHIGERGPLPGQFNFPTALAWQASIGLVVADAMNFRVQVFDDAGRPISVFGHKGDAAGNFARPRSVAIDSAGHIYVLDNQFENVQIFDQHGQLLMAFGQEGEKPGEFALPSGITIDERDRIWIADSNNRRVQVFQYLRENA